MINVYNSPTSMNPPQGAERAFRRWLFYLIVIGICGILIYWGLISRGKEFEIKISAKKGNIEYRENDKDGWKEVSTIPFNVYPQYEIRTFENSQATFLVEDGSEIRLGEFGRIILISNQGKIDFVQTDGSSHHQIAKNDSRKEYKVSFGDGDIFAQGTAFELKIKENETDVFSLESELKLVYKDKSTAFVKEGEKLVITPVGKITKELEEGDLKESWTHDNLALDQEKKLVINEAVLNKAGIEINQPMNLEAVSQSSDDQNNNNENINENENANQSSDNNQNSQSSSEINVKDSGENQNGNSNANTSSSESSAVTQDQNSQSTQVSTDSVQTPVTSGSASRSKCENSGGHWNTNNLCSCPTNKVFSNGKCVSTNSGSDNLADTLVLRSNISGKSTDLSWVANGGKTPYGYKVINVTDGSSKKASKKITSWGNLKSGKTYKFQVCVLNASGGCASYSNTRSVKIP